LENEDLLFFQILDEKKECGAIFFNNNLVDIFKPGEMTHTWSFSPHIKSLSIEYANIWSGGATLDQVCPEEIKEEWKRINNRAKSFLASFELAKINLGDNCLYDLLPENFLLEFYDLKNQITKSVFEKFERPKNYDFLVDLVCFLHGIKARKLNLKFENLKFTDQKVRNSFGKIKEIPPYIHYNPWNTATGRLATMPNSFPILNLNKELRSAICPNNDLFIEFDYNAAELRVLFALLKQDQPKEDVHMWVSKNIFESKYDRDTTKKKVFAWLYNPKAKNKKLNSYLNREKILENFYKNGHVATPFGREIAVEEEKAVNYMIQSTTSDLFLTSAIKIDKILKNKKSKIAFCVHDSLVIDFAKEEKNLISELAKIFSQTKFGILKTNMSIGKNYGSMGKIQ
jgi:hypothetical protein